VHHVIELLPQHVIARNEAISAFTGVRYWFVSIVCHLSLQPLPLRPSFCLDTKRNKKIKREKTFHATGHTPGPVFLRAFALFSCNPISALPSCRTCFGISQTGIVMHSPSTISEMPKQVRHDGVSECSSRQQISFGRKSGGQQSDS
jgi:hypothetical protein